MKYLVTSPGGRTITLEARNSKQAKIAACKYWNIKPGDKWCGAAALKTRKVKERYGCKPDAAAAGKETAPANAESNPAKRKTPGVEATGYRMIC